MTKVDVISGFLGAGKTTLIKKLLKEALGGEQVVLIENEFGEIGVDGGFLKEAGVEIREMNSGCICCSLVGDFAASLEEVIHTYHPDRIIIEPSGVGKLSDVTKAVANAVKDEDVVLGSAITVVDANKCKMYLKNFGEFFKNQVENAGTIMLSRTGNISGEKLSQCIELIKGLNDHALIITTPWEQLTGEQILGEIEKRADLAAELLRELEAHADEDDDDEEDCCCGHHHDDEEDDHHHHHHDGDEEDEHEHHHHHHDDEEEDEHEHHHHHHDEDEEDEHEHHHHHDGDEEDEHEHHHHHDGDEEDEHEHHHHHHDEDEEDEHEHHHHHHDGDEEDEHEHHHHHDGDEEDEHEHHHHHHDGDEEDEHEHHHHHDEDGECGCGHHHDHDGHHHGHHHHHADEVFTSWGYETPAVFTRQQLETIMSALNSDCYGVVLRSKGMVASEEPGKWLYFDMVPGECDIREGAPQVTGRICVIGSKLQEDMLAILFGRK